MYLGETKAKPSLSILSTFTSLTELGLDNHNRNIDTISQLTGLQKLTLRSAKIADYRILVPLQRLESLELKLGGVLDLDALQELKALRFLSIWMVRGLADLTTISQLHYLEELHLESLRNVSQLPDLSRLLRLKKVTLETMKGITDLSALLTSPSLEVVQLIAMGQLQPEDVGVLARLRSGKKVTAGLGSMTKNAKAEALVCTFD